MCSTCENEHRTLKTTKRHTLLDKNNMSSSLRDKFTEDEYNVTCDIHPKELIKYVCPTHETVNCGHCVVFGHRSCKISLISEISDSYKNGQEYSDIKKSIAKIRKYIDDRACDVESNIDMIVKQGEDEIKKLKYYREKVNNYFDERERSLHDIITQMRDMDKTRLDSLKTKYDTFKAKLDEMKCKLDAHERNSVNLFIEAKNVRKQIECLEAALNDISNGNIVHRYQFIKDTATENLLAANAGLGKVIEDQPTGKQKVPIDLTSLKFTEAPIIPVESYNDIECRLTSMLLLPEDRLLLSDFNNSTLKLVDLHTSTMISQIELPGKPWGMCVLPGDRVAVSLYNTRCIIFLETRGEIVIGSSIKVERKCYDIAYHHEMLIVALIGGKIVKMDMNGNIMKYIETVNEQALLSSCYNLTLTADGQEVAIFLSEFWNNKITKLDMDLNLLQTFKDPALQSPCGLTAVENQLLICNGGNHTILCLDLSSGNMVELLGKGDGIQHPYSVIYSPGQKKLYITSNGSGNCLLDDNVHVYKA